MTFGLSLIDPHRTCLPSYAELLKASRELCAALRGPAEIVAVSGYGDKKRIFARNVTLAAARHGVACRLASVCEIMDGTMSIDQMLEKLGKVIKQECTTHNIILVGHSLGGLMVLRTAQTLTQDKSINVLAAVVGSPGITKTTDSNWILRQPNSEVLMQEWREKGRITTPTGMVITKQFLEDKLKLVSEVESNSWCCPVHIIGAKDDEMISYRACMDFAENVSSCGRGRIYKHTVFEGGHFYATNGAQERVQEITSNILDQLGYPSPEQCIFPEGYSTELISSAVKMLYSETVVSRSQIPIPASRNGTARSQPSPPQ